jgi:BED zinc finger
MNEVVPEGKRARDFFNVTKDVGECKICSTKIKSVRSSTSGYLRHLKSKHNINLYKTKVENKEPRFDF